MVEETKPSERRNGEKNGLAGTAAGKLQKMLVAELKRRNDAGESLRSIGAELGITHTAVKKLMSEERGEGVPIETTLDRLRSLGVSMQQILSELSPDEAAQIVYFMDEYKPHYRALAKLIKKGGRDLDMLLALLERVTEDDQH